MPSAAITPTLPRCPAIIALIPRSPPSPSSAPPPSFLVLRFLGSRALALRAPRALRTTLFGPY
eukprot:scaffold5414_cov40-Tisochrysis_lutea.AAC.1